MFFCKFSKNLSWRYGMTPERSQNEFWLSKTTPKPQKHYIVILNTFFKRKPPFWSGFEKMRMCTLVTIFQRVLKIFSSFFVQMKVEYPYFRNQKFFTRDGTTPGFWLMWCGVVKTTPHHHTKNHTTPHQNHTNNEQHTARHFWQ